VLYLASEKKEGEGDSYMWILHIFQMLGAGCGDIALIVYLNFRLLVGAASVFVLVHRCFEKHVCFLSRGRRPGLVLLS